MDERKNVRTMKSSAAKYKKLCKILAASGSILSITAFVVSLASGWIIVKLYRTLDTAQKTLPVIKKAAQLYIDSNAVDKTKDAKRKAERADRQNA